MVKAASAAAIRIRFMLNLLNGISVRLKQCTVEFTTGTGSSTWISSEIRVEGYVAIMCLRPKASVLQRTFKEGVRR
jgi:hypothetical protein